ncbi:MAG TPA: hypothetical protein PK760_10245, partial [Flavobacteriales bacterium]|nr:hypothetical protein [Flavobacteriales bacterium]
SAVPIFYPNCGIAGPCGGGLFSATMKFSALLLFFLLVMSARAQVLTAEDSLNAGLVRNSARTLVSGYGEVKVSYDQQLGTGTANVTRNVLFLGHRFSDRITFFSEMELENARVEGNRAGGEISMEQLFLKFDLNKDIYLVGGLFIPRLGIINENHLPTTFNGNDRPFVEQLVIPSTWREVGVGLYGKSPRLPGLNWSLALQNGLNAADFSHGSGIREGRGEGSNASAGNFGVNGALLYYVGDFRIQTSAYYGGAAGLTQREADSLQLDYGAFGTPVRLLEMNAQYHGEGFRMKVLAAQVDIPDAGRVNRAYASNTPERMTGVYAEVGYDLWSLIKPAQKRDLVAFVRYESLDMNKAIPTNGINDPTLARTYIVGGFTYVPVGGISVKLDYVMRSTGAPNPALAIGPYPRAQPYFTQNGFLNIGLAYSF